MMVEELAYHNSPLGELILRKREEPLLQNRVIYEVKLGDEFLMSSLFTEGEEQLATLGLAGVEPGAEVVVGGLGLGYTATAALQDERVSRLLVIELFEEVIGWHRDGLVPLGEELSNDPRCELRQGDFFALAKTGFDAEQPERTFDAVLLDIDHSPEHSLDEGNIALYSVDGLIALRDRIKENGTFAMWSNDPPADEFTERLRLVFGRAEAHRVEFPNPYTNAVSQNSIYTAQNVRGAML